MKMVGDFACGFPVFRVQVLGFEFIWSVFGAELKRVQLPSQWAIKDE
jgi:hypothetical protein